MQSEATYSKIHSETVDAEGKVQQLLYTLKTAFNKTNLEEKKTARSQLSQILAFHWTWLIGEPHVAQLCYATGVTDGDASSIQHP